MDIFVGNYYADGSELTDPNSSKPFEMNEDFSRAKNGGTSRIFLVCRQPVRTPPSVVYRDAGNVFPNNGAHAWTLAGGAADLDRDGLSDYLHRQRLRTRPVAVEPLHARQGPLSGTERRGRLHSSCVDVIGNDSFKGMSVDFADVNNDGIFDMYVSNIASPFALQESHFLWVSTGKMDQMKKGMAPWVDRAEDLGVAHSAWAWDARFEDFDNCGTWNWCRPLAWSRDQEPLARFRPGRRRQRQIRALSHVLAQVPRRLRR